MVPFYKPSKKMKLEDLDSEIEISTDGMAEFGGLFLTELDKKLLIECELQAY